MAYKKQDTSTACRCREERVTGTTIQEKAMSPSRYISVTESVALYGVLSGV